jgi:ankyrin repeat protein
MSQEPSRSLPDRPDLEQQKKQARELLDAFHTADPTARSRVRLHLPDKAEITLADAQFVLAREYGFESWTKLKTHIEAACEVPPRVQFQQAVERGDVATTRRVLERHAEARAAVNEPLFSFGSTALMHAASAEDLALLDVLLEHGADVNRRSDWWAGGFHVLHGARRSVADYLIERGAVPDACAAAHLDRLDLLRQMLEEDPGRVHERGGDGQTPLHFATSRAGVDLLLAYGADVNARDVDHRSTPAQWMLDRRRGAGRYALAEYLVARGAEVDIFLAAALGLTARLRSLLTADPGLLDLRTTQGEYGEKPPSSFHIYMWTIGANLSPLQVAAQFEQDAAVNVMHEFASPRQRFLSACAESRADEARAILRERPQLVAQLTPQEQRILPDAAWNNDVTAVELMLELGFDPFTPGQDSGTVLHCSAWEGNVACVQVVLRHPTTRELVRHRETTHGGTPLDWCCHGAEHCRNPRGDYPKVARLLLEAGAEPGPNVEEAPVAVRRAIKAWRPAAPRSRAPRN